MKKPVATVCMVLPLLAALLSPPVHARTWHIHADATGDAPTIQAGIDSSSSGDTVSVAAGAYTECLDLKGKNILLAGAGPGMTVLTGAPGDAVITFQSGETNACTLTGFTITGGEGHPFPTYRLGGGLYIHDAEPSILDNEICSNGAIGDGPDIVEHAGGIYCEGYLHGPGWSPVIRNNLVIGNHSQVNGGGLYLVGHVSARVEDNQFTENSTVEGDGGAIAALVYRGDQTILRNVLDHNIAGDHGGGIYLASASSPAPTAEVSFNLIWSNQGKGTSTITHTGGGIFVSGVQTDIFRNTIVDNSGMWGGGIAVGKSTPVALERNIIAYSTGTNLNCIGPTQVVATDNVFWKDPYSPFPVDGACEQMLYVAGNVNLDPRLCDWQSGDTSISGDSPAARDGAAYSGAGEVRAGCLTPVERVTWGRLKARY